MCVECYFFGDLFSHFNLRVKMQVMCSISVDFVFSPCSAATNSFFQSLISVNFLWNFALLPVPGISH